MKVAVLALLLSSTAAAQVITVRAKGHEVEVDLAKLPRATLEVRDPTDGNQPKTFEGVPLAKVLAGVPMPGDSDAIAVRCNDGWLSLLDFGAVIGHPTGLLATTQLGAPIAAPRGPVFLVWPALARTDTHLSANGWTWGVASLEYVRKRDFVTPLYAPGASPVAVRGGQLFEKHCQHCHAINGAGGMAGWDLNQPNVLTYRTEAYVRDYILDPKSRNADGHMLPFRSKLKRSDLDALLAYFHSLHR